MRGCLRVTATLVAFVFIIAAILVLFVVNLAQIVTNRTTMKDVLDVGPTIVEVGPMLLVEAMQREARSQGVVVEDIDTAVLQDAVREIAPPEWVDAQADTAIDAMFDYLETGNMEEATLEIEMRPVIERLRGETGERAVRDVLQSLPVCPDPQPTYNLTPDNLAIPGCLPTAVSVDEATQAVQAIVDNTLTKNPNLLDEAGVIQMSVFEAAKRVGGGQELLQRLQQLFLRAQRWGWFLWLIPATLLLLIAVLAVRSWSDLGNWWGWPLAITAVASFGIAFGIPAIAAFLLRTSLVLAPQAGAPFIPPDQILRRLAQPLTALWQNRIFVQAGGMFILGVALIFLGFIAGASQRRRETIV
ncbi:MAG: hypothetical protein GY803_22850 [Chloroflexi bacterium]|nr:hypothetical protein [Chloroflexota bacterium]